MMDTYRTVRCATCGGNAFVNRKGEKQAVYQGPDPCACGPTEFRMEE